MLVLSACAIILVIYRLVVLWLDAGELETISKLEKGGLDKLFSVFKK